MRRFPTLPVGLIRRIWRSITDGKGLLPPDHRWWQTRPWLDHATPWAGPLPGGSSINLRRLYCARILLWEHPAASAQQQNFGCEAGGPILSEEYLPLPRHLRARPNT